MNHAHLSTKDNANADMTSFRKAFRCLKVLGMLILFIVRFYLFAWFYVPRAFLTDVRAPQTLSELEYQAKDSPAFLIAIALGAIFMSCTVSCVLYVLPALVIAKHF